MLTPRTATLFALIPCCVLFMWLACGIGSAVRPLDSSAGLLAAEADERVSHGALVYGCQGLHQGLHLFSQLCFSKSFLSGFFFIHRARPSVTAALLFLTKAAWHFELDEPFICLYMKMVDCCETCPVNICSDLSVSMAIILFGWRGTPASVLTLGITK